MSPFNPTPDPACNQILLELISGIRPVLADNFLGAYLQGSFAHGGWDQDSDVDFIVVIDHALAPENLQNLKQVHADLQKKDIYWAHHLEGSYFPKAILGDLSRLDEPLDYLDNGSLDFERSTHDNSLVVRRVLRRHGLVLAGPQPSIWVPSVPDELLKAEVWEVMQAWGGQILAGDYDMNNGWAQPFVVLSYCRMLHTLASGDVFSKAAGAAWAKESLPQKWTGLIDAALADRTGQYLRCCQPADPDRQQETFFFIEAVLENAYQRFGMK